MRPAAMTFALLLAALGVVWVGQGLGYIRGSFMTGDPKWAWIGAGCLVGALMLAAATSRRRRRPPAA